MDKNEKEKLKSETLDNLKLKLEKKLEKVKSELKILNFKLENNVNEKRKKIKNKINKYICSLKDKSIAYVKDKEKKIQDKEIMNKIYFNAIRTSKKIERFQKNMNDIIFDSINNYNNFISYYKNSCLLFLRNHEDKICNNNIICQTSESSVAYVNGVSEALFKVGMCLPAGPYVSDDDVHYIVETIKAAIE